MRISNQAASILKPGSNNPIAAIISRIPVIYISACLKGMEFGIIMVIPLTKKKCAVEVKHNMTDMAILADNVNGCWYPPIKVSTIQAILKTEIRTIRGFIL